MQNVMWNRLVVVSASQLNALQNYSRKTDFWRWTEFYETILYGNPHFSHAKLLVRHGSEADAESGTILGSHYIIFTRI